MDSIGAEVGQKMRSAIKAKLLELNCYVDDELPDYIMVMVANKRTKSQMKDDLQLFLTNKTVPFVDWLHIVLKKLKEVTVTNPEIYKKATSKRKSSEDYSTLPIDVKKEKKVDKKLIKSEPDSTTINNNNNEDDEATTFKSLTDDLPINANKLSKQRKIVVMKENQQSNNSYDNKKDNFDIPLLSEVNMSNEEELEMIERKIKNVKTRLGLNINDNNDDDDDYINLKAEPDELFGDELKTNRTIQIIDNIKLNQTNDQQDTINKPTRTRITFNEDELNDKTKKPSILDRLGKRRSDNVKESSNYNKRTRISFNSDKTKESVLNRLGVMSKISIPQKSQQQLQEPQKQQSQEDDEENLLKTRDVPSVVKIKPRVIPNEVVQPNKNLLLKAVADAQRSIAQAPKVGVNAIKRDALFTKRYKEKTTRKLPEVQKEKLKKMLESTDDKEIPQYIPTPIDKIQQTNNEIKQQFIITLDGIEKTKFKVLIDDKNDHQNIKPSIKSRLDTKKTPSPIIFDKSTPTTTAATITTPTTITSTKSIIPDRLPIIHPPPSIKNKERCKYWPQCRQGDKCEFVHPTINCELFPNCKFGGDKCLYLHPICKFGSSCTRRDCLYSHHHIIKTICKYYPNCTNVACQFYHPKLCKFGKNCKNQDCSFSHDFTTTRNSLVWKPKF